MTNRPDPDALLATLAHEGEAGKRGRLKIYLGMAAGVGKTYTMLTDGQEAKRRGIDVVVGYLQAHGRTETECLANGLETIPLKEVEHQGIVLKEFNIDATLERHPGLVLVDELAHTNAPGSRHRRRWQDVQDLLEAGIDVSTTVNIQHLEGLKDVVAQITGVIVTETLPDSFVQNAQEIELIDLTPDELIHRIREGKVYIPVKIDQALDGFFKKRNLVALRELALRRTAEQVDQQVRTFRAAEGVITPWHTTERILICIAPNSLSMRVVRVAHRMAAALHGQIFAVTVESARQREVGKEGAKFAFDALHLAEELGIETSVLAGPDIVKEILTFAQTHNITTMVVGKPIRPRWKEFMFGSVLDSLIRASGDINVHVITDSEQTGTRIRTLPDLHKPDWKGWILALVSTGICTGISYLLEHVIQEVGIVMVYMLGVATVGSRAGKSAAFIASLLTVLSFNFYFTSPRYSFSVADPNKYLVVFLVMLIVGILISVLTSRLRDESESSSLRTRRVAALYELSRKLAGTRSRREIADFAAEQIRKVFDCDAAVLIKSRKTGELFSTIGSISLFETENKEKAVAAWVADHGKRAGKTTDTLPGSEGLYVPLNAENGCVGVLAVRFEGTSALDVAQEHLLNTYANQLAVALERTNLAKDSHEVSLAMESERLRSALLSTVSHDLRTPLSVIAGSADQLRRSPTLTDPKDRELAIALASEAERLEIQVRNLLDMTRLESGPIELRKEWQSVEELIGQALIFCDPLLANHSVKVELPPELPLLKLDGELMEHVFVNLIENAVRHTPRETEIRIKGAPHTETIEIYFENNGPSLVEGEEEMIFAKFSRSSATNGRGSGLGLAICRSIVEAHGGSISAQSLDPQGVRFAIALPIIDKAPETPHD